MLRVLIVGVVCGLCAAATPVLAHTGVSATHDLTHGFLHPLGGLDHILAMVAVGLYATQLGGRNLWLVPAAFVATMVLGGLAGYVGIPLPLVEQGIGLSVVAMSLAVALGVRVPTLAAMAMVGVFALFHGHAHGSEGAELGSFVLYAAGFVAATVALHAVGMALGIGLGRLGERRSNFLTRAAGIAGAAAGVAILAG